MSNRKNISFNDRVKLVDWMRATEGTTKNLTGDEFVERARQGTGVETSLAQLRRLANQVGIEIDYRGRQGQTGNQWTWLKQTLEDIERRLSYIEDSLDIVPGDSDDQ